MNDQQLQITVKMITAIVQRIRLHYARRFPNMFFFHLFNNWISIFSSPRFWIRKQNQNTHKIDWEKNEMAELCNCCSYKQLRAMIITIILFTVCWHFFVLFDSCFIQLAYFRFTLNDRQVYIRALNYQIKLLVYILQQWSPVWQMTLFNFDEQNARRRTIWYSGM